MTVIRGSAPLPTTLQPAPLHISFGQVAALHPYYRYACARKYGYKYLLGAQEPMNLALVMGRAFDEGLNAFFRLRMTGASAADAWPTVVLAATVAFDTQIDDAVDPPRDEGSHLDALRLGLRATIAAQEHAVPAAVQQHHTFTVRSLDGERTIVVDGYSDRIDADGTVVDHKWSGSPRWDRADVWDADWVREKRDQACFYWMARVAEAKRGVEQPAPISNTARLVVCYMRARNRTPVVRSLDLRFGEADVVDIVRRIGEAEAIRRAGRLPARPGEACRFCFHLGRCRDDEQARGMDFPSVTGVAA